MVTSGPRLEKPTLLPAWRSAATATTPGQLPGTPTASPAVLPAAATTRALRAVTWVMTSRYSAPVLSLAAQLPSPPRLRLSTRAGFALTVVIPGTLRPTAHFMPAMMSES